MVRVKIAIAIAIMDCEIGSGYYVYLSNTP